MSKKSFVRIAGEASKVVISEATAEAIIEQLEADKPVVRFMAADDDDGEIATRCRPPASSAYRRGRGSSYSALLYPS